MGRQRQNDAELPAVLLLPSNICFQAVIYSHVTQTNRTTNEWNPQRPVSLKAKKPKTKLGKLCTKEKIITSGMLLTVRFNILI